MKSPFQRLPLDDAVGDLTVRELLARSHDGPIEILNDAGRTVIRVDGDWMTFGARPYPGEERTPGVTSAELMEKLHAIDRRAAEERAAQNLAESPVLAGAGAD